MNKEKVLTAMVIGLLLGLAVLVWFGLDKIKSLNAELALTKQEFASSTLDFENEIDELEAQLEEERDENDELNDGLQAEKERNDGFEERIDEISGTVKVLDKLSKTDKELLQKYSKIYFLNEHYVPDKLVEIDTQYVFKPEEVEQIHANVWPFLERMLKAAARADVDLKIISAFRSFGEQTALKSGYKFLYGSGANQFSADQGYSEHQLGTTVDLTTPALGLAFEGINQTPAYTWLQNNAHKYGFTLSYPQGNAYYQFEPWHWRFVGEELATKLHKAEKFFYDLEQREIDTYLLVIFD